MRLIAAADRKDVGDGRRTAPPRGAWPLILLAILLAEIAALYPGILFRGEVLTSAALGYGLPPWKGHAPETARPLRGNPILSDDLVLLVPWDESVRQAIATGSMPLWEPRIGCGLPLLANNQSAVFAVTQSLRWIWNSPRARTFGLLFKIPLAGLGMFLLLTVCGLRPEAALIGALAWANASVMTVWLLYPLSETAAWFPWVLAGIRLTLDEVRGRSWAGGIALALAIAAMLLAGHLPTAVQLAVAGAVATVAWLLGDRAACSRVTRLLIPILSGVLLAMPQILPFGVYALNSTARLNRGGAVATGAIPLPPASLWNWIVPRGFGSPERFGYLGPSNFNEAAASVGLAPLLLACVGLLLARRRAARSLGLLIGLAAALAYGLPPLPWLAGHVPFLRLESAGRWSMLAQFGVAALAALGVAGLIERIPGRRDLMTMMAVAAAALLLILSHPMLRRVEPDIHAAVAAREILGALGELTLVAVGLSLACSRWRLAGVVSLAVLTACAGVRLAWDFNPVIDSAAIPGPNTVTRRLAELAGDGRILSSGWVLRDDTGILADLSTVTGRDELLSPRYARLMEQEEFKRLEQPGSVVLPATRFIRRCATALIVTDRPVKGPGVTAVEEPPVEAGQVEKTATPGIPAKPSAVDDGFLPYRIVGKHPLVGWYPRARGSATEEDALGLIAGGLVTDDTVVVEGERIEAPSPMAGSEPIELPFRFEGPNRLITTIEQEGSGWLVFRETADPGWRAHLDGSPIKWLHADGLFMAMPIPAGRHSVVFEYRPPGWSIAVSCAVAGLLLLLWLLVAGVVRLIRAKRTANVLIERPTSVK